MDGQVHITSVNIDYAQVKYNVYIAKSLDDAKDYISKNGGMMFHDIGLDRLVVMPESVKGFSGQIDLPKTED